jgi:hypothetical protein
VSPFLAVEINKPLMTAQSDHASYQSGSASAPWQCRKPVLQDLWHDVVRQAQEKLTVFWVLLLVFGRVELRRLHAGL